MFWPRPGQLAQISCTMVLAFSFLFFFAVEVFVVGSRICCFLLLSFVLFAGFHVFVSGCLPPLSSHVLFLFLCVVVAAKCRFGRDFSSC